MHAGIHLGKGVCAFRHESALVVVGTALYAGSMLQRTSLVLAILTAALTVAACGDDEAGDDVVGDDTGGDDTGGDDTGPACVGDQQLADISEGTWDDRFTIAGVTGHDGIAPAIYDFAQAPDGSILAAGRFQWFEGEPTAPLLRWRDGAWEPARTTWELPAPLDGFAAVAIADDGALALATNDSFGDRGGEIWIDDGTGLHAVGEFVGQVRTMVWFGGALWVAGRYTIEDGATPIDHLAIWTGAAWVAPAGGQANDSVFELVVDGDGVLAGGAFSAIGGIAAAKVARFDGDDWTAFDLPDGVAVFGLARDAGGELYAGGSLVELFGDVPGGGLARWDGDAWEIVGGGVATFSLPGVVTDLVAHDGVVDAIGCFTAVGGAYDDPDAVHVRDAARWNGTGWEALDDGSAPLLAPWFQPLVCGDEGPAAVWDVVQQRLAVDGDRLLVGGMAAGGGDALSQALVVRDGDDWQPQGRGGLGLGGALDRVAARPDGCEVYGLGTVTHVAGVPGVAHLLKFTGDEWEIIGDSIESTSWCPTLAVSPSGEVAVGCMDQSDAGDVYGSILRVTGNELVRVPVDLPGIVQHIVYDPDGTLWIGGGGELGFLAKLEGDQLTVVEDGFDSIVLKLAVHAADDIVVGGMFANVDGVAANRIARWNGTTWSALGAGVPGQPVALAIDDAGVYVSTYDEGSGAYLLGKYDGTAWSELATPAAGVTPQSYFSLEQILPVDGGLLLGGSIELDDESGRGLLLYRDGHLSALGGGVRAMSVGGVALSRDAVWVAGYIAEAGNETAKVPSVGVARFIRASTPF
jgi:hypothetical protein